MSLESRRRDHTARIGILGLGYVGLPLAMEFCRKGFRVAGFDVSASRVGSLRQGRSYVEDVQDAELSRFIKAAKRPQVERL